MDFIDVVQVVRTLLGNGCDSDITDNEGLTAAELAEKCGHLHTAALLRGEDVHEVWAVFTLICGW